MAKFKNGSECRVLKNAREPSYIGHIVTILKPLLIHNGIQYYMTVEGTNYGSMFGIAAENCLELVKKTRKCVDY